MKLLNRDRLPNYPGIMHTKCDPDVKAFKFRGKHIWYDIQSMKLWDVKPEVAEVMDPNSIGSEEKPYITPMVMEQPHKMLVFQTTYACNLDCSYCFVTHHYLNHTNRLAYDTAINAVDIYQSPRFGKPYNIGFFGGEPLMNWTVISKLVNEIARRAKQYGFDKKDVMRGRGYQFHVTTNATLVTEEIAEFLAEHGFSIIVSIDGDKEFHDQNRPYHKGEGTHDDVMRGLHYIKEAYNRKGKPTPVTLRSTYDRSGVDLPKQLEYLNQLMYDGLGGHISIEPSSLGESCSTAPARFETNAYDEIRAMFEDEYWRAADWFLEELKKGRKPSFHHFEMVLQRVYDRQPAFSECGAGNGYLSIGPGGKISACHRENGSELGWLKTGIDKTKQAKWLFSNLSFTRNPSACPSCYRRHMCGGGCRQESIQGGNDINTPDQIECLFKYMYTEPALWMMSEMTEEQLLKYSKFPNGIQQQQNTNFNVVGAPQSSAAMPSQMNQIPTRINVDAGQPPRTCNDPNCGCKAKAREHEAQQQQQQTKVEVAKEKELATVEA